MVYRVSKTKSNNCIVFSLSCENIAKFTPIIGLARSKRYSLIHSTKEYIRSSSRIHGFTQSLNRKSDNISKGFSYYE